MAKEKSPTFKQDKLKTGVTTVVTLKKATPAATGQSQYGEWQLWVVGVENAVVEDRNTKQLVENYTGEAVCFPSTGMIEAFNAITGGTKEGCKVSITKEFKENDEGKPYTVYNVEEVGVTSASAEPAIPGTVPIAAPVVSQGQTPPNALSDLQLTFIKDFKSFVDRKIVNESREVFDKFGKTAPYIFDDATLETLWKVYQE